MIRQQPEGHDTFAPGDSCFCVAKVAPVALSVITDSVNKPSDRAIKSDRAKVVMTAGCISRKFWFHIYDSREIGISINQNLLGEEKIWKNFIKVLTEVQLCCNIYIVVAEIQQSKALELNACRGCFERSDKKYFKKFLTKGTGWGII